MIRLFFLIFTLASCTNSPVINIEQEKSTDLTNKLVPVEIFDSIHDEKINLTNGNYEVTVLIFFDLDCIHCQNAINSIETTLIPVIDKKRFHIIGIGRGHNKDYLVNWSDKNKIAMQLVADENKSIYKQFADKGVPHIFIIDQKGVIRLVTVGWSTKIIDILRKALTPKTNGATKNA